MARGTFLSRFRREPGGPRPEPPASVLDGAPEDAPPATPPTPEDSHAPVQDAVGHPALDQRRRRPPWHPGELRRERRALVRAREERIRDLGGLILEMFRRDRFREDLMREQAEEIFGMEARIQEIDGLLTATIQQVQAARCECGAPLVWGSHFCANCGRPTGEAVVTCTNCGQPLPADTRFCGNCGTPAPVAVPAPAEPQLDAQEQEPPSTAENSDAAVGLQQGSPPQAVDSWESPPAGGAPRPSEPAPGS